MQRREGRALQARVWTRALMGVFLSVCFLFCAETVTTARISHGNLYAVVVGVGTFLNYKEFALKAPPNDAKEFAECLKEQASLYRGINISVLVNDQATRASVASAIEKAIKEAGEYDTVILYFSGDAKTDSSALDVYFNTYDADLDKLPATALNLSDGAIFRNLKAKRVLLIVDACLPSVQRLCPLAVPQRTAVVTASMPGEAAHEDPKLPTSVFTYHLLKGLAGAADVDSVGVVTLDEAFKYARNATIQHSPQRPLMENRVQGEFPLAAVKSATPEGKK